MYRSLAGLGCLSYDWRLDAEALDVAGSLTCSDHTCGEVASSNNLASLSGRRARTPVRVIHGSSRVHVQASTIFCRDLRRAEVAASLTVTIRPRDPAEVQMAPTGAAKSGDRQSAAYKGPIRRTSRKR